MERLQPPKLPLRPSLAVERPSFGILFFLIYLVIPTLMWLYVLFLLLRIEEYIHTEKFYFMN